MQNHVREFDVSIKSKRLLIGGMRARKLLLATPLLKWYLEHGIEVTKIYQTVEYTKQACYSHFVRNISDGRRLGDADPSKSIIADTRKPEGNSFFGATIMDKEKIQDVAYVKGEGSAMMAANLPQFKKLTQLTEEDEYYEIEKAKQTLRLNIPIQLGYFILHNAKLHNMLQFYYDFMDKYVDRVVFEYCEMDTASAYMALSGPDFISIIKADMESQYLEGLEGYCKPGLVAADCQKHWFSRTCCSTHANYDRRTPGLFKIEYEGDAMIGLCSKTYIVAQKKSKITSSTVFVVSRLLRKSQMLRRKRLPKSFRRVYYET